MTALYYSDAHPGRVAALLQRRAYRPRGSIFKVRFGAGQSLISYNEMLLQYPTVKLQNQDLFDSRLLFYSVKTVPCKIFKCIYELINFVYAKCKYYRAMKLSLLQINYMPGRNE